MIIPSDCAKNSILQSSCFGQAPISQLAQIIESNKHTKQIHPQKKLRFTTPPGAHKLQNRSQETPFPRALPERVTHLPALRPLQVGCTALLPSPLLSHRSDTLWPLYLPLPLFLFFSSSFLARYTRVSPPHAQLLRSARKRARSFLAYLYLQSNTLSTSFFLLRARPRGRERPLEAASGCCCCCWAYQWARHTPGDRGPR